MLSTDSNMSYVELSEDCGVFEKGWEHL